ncbi:MAG: twin-arginine translocation signal domain-containing protein [Rhodobiaceae bacterium]|nr:twin-arginine translocation signal domain-containing protein [Rhodobiaceae bacterium]MCC0041051.1 twin-arginine translocation signal domain-containing protein [Rhodobiaceae bacterium]MCC0053942.1 twin-arginine translocation signal domain-containing protein [Rhodobiaceae bacterium]
MAANPKDAGTDRRSFLKLAGMGSVAGGAALVAGTEKATAEAPGKTAASGYRETEQVKTFYATARF